VKASPELIGSEFYEIHTICDSSDYSIPLGSNCHPVGAGPCARPVHGMVIMLRLQMTTGPANRSMPYDIFHPKIRAATGSRPYLEINDHAMRWIGRDERFV